MKKSKLAIICTSLVMMLLVGSMPLFALEEPETETIPTSEDIQLVETDSTDETEQDIDLTESLEEDKTDTNENVVANDFEEVSNEVVSDEPSAEAVESVALFADINNITNVDELQAAVASASDGDTITLSEAFTADAATLVIDNKTITIDGNGVTWDKGGITVSGNGTLTLKNIKMDGTNTTTRLLTVSLGSGVLNIESMDFLNGKNGALDIRSNASTQVFINRSRINNNTSGTGPAIFMAGSSKVHLNYTSIENNSGTAAGYEAGAIASKNFSGILEINNSLLAYNINKAANSGVVGGGGGAVSIHYFSGTFNIKDSIFKGNRTNGDNGSRASTYDGGAIYLFNMRNTGSFNVQGSSFIDNVAYDDGGAILIQTEGSGNGDIVDKITFNNNTFYGNKAYGVDIGSYAGGAIQIFANVGFTGELHTKANFEGNTFANNTIGGIADSAVSLSGSALGLSMSSMKSTMKITLNNNLFAGNYVLNRSGSIIEGNKTIYPTTRFENADHTTTNVGTNSANQFEEYEKTFGLYPVSLSKNYTAITAGVDNVVIPSLAIKPEGLAENKAGAEIAGYDQRQYARYKDFGATESTWLQYDANGGVFGLQELTQYDGQTYYEPNSDNVVTNVYSVGYVGYSDSIKSVENLKLSRDGYEFLGWADSADALVANPQYDGSQSILHKGENQTIYAVWKEVKTQFTVKYTDGIDGQAFVDQLYVVDEGELTPEFAGTPTRVGYTFTGWSPAVANTVSANAVYVAQWEKIVIPVKDYTVTYTDGSNNESFFKNQSFTVKEGVNTPNFSGTPTRIGYTFTGWSPSVTNVVSADVTYVAQWEKVVTPIEMYTITYTDGSNSESYFKDEVFSAQKGSETPLHTGSKIREGYEFAGWNPDFSGFVEGDVTYVAIWVKVDEPIQNYSVKYTDGSNNESYFKDEVYTVEKGSKTPYFLGSLNREGYKFIGWTPEVSNVVDGDGVYVAIWKKVDIIKPVDPTEPTKPVEPGKPTQPAEVLPSTGVESNVTKAMLTVTLITLGFGLIILNNNRKRKHSN